MELFCILGNIHICIFMSMAPITLFCKSSQLFKNMLNMLSSFEINSALVSPPFPSFKEKLMPKRNKSYNFPIVSGSHSFGISVHHHSIVKESKELLGASCIHTSFELLASTDPLALALTGCEKCCQLNLWWMRCYQGELHLHPEDNCFQ